MQANFVPFEEANATWNQVQQFWSRDLAIYLTIKHFCHYVEGQNLYTVIDHKPLVYSLFVIPIDTLPD